MLLSDKQAKKFTFFGAFTFFGQDEHCRFESLIYLKKVLAQVFQLCLSAINQINSMSMSWMVAVTVSADTLTVRQLIAEQFGDGREKPLQKVIERGFTK